MQGRQPPSSAEENLGITARNAHPAGLCGLVALAVGCCCSLPVAAQAAPPALAQRSLHPPGVHSGFAAINLIGHWMSMLPHPITTGKVVDLQKGGENAAVRISQVGCCFLGRSWLLNTVEPRTKGRNQSLLLFGSAGVGFDPIYIKTKP